mmetsp:Transcript_8174/g.26793  ORF Transcript_8174/g.26793 Transcript_8174/m.26793 type:complete len:560 (-) Transcript_8174:197-1876(-)
MGALDDAKIGDTPFSVLMQQAVKLKSHIHKIDRVKFDRWPKFYQNSAFVRDEQRLERKLPYAERMVVAQSYKKAGDEHFVTRKDYLQASLNYEWALGLFKWATPVDENWRNKSVEDSEMLEETFQGDTPEEHDAIQTFRVTCLLNLGKAYFHQKEYVTARQACDWALALDGADPRALLLRARCLVTPPSSGTTERDAAIVDLEAALRATTAGGGAEGETAAFTRKGDDDPSFAPGRRRPHPHHHTTRAAEKEIKALLADLKKEKQAAKVHERQYAGLFDRGELYDRDETFKRQRPYLPGEDDLAGDDEARLLERTPLDARLDAAKRLMVQYAEEGRTADAEELRKHVDDTHRALAAKQQRQKEPPPKLDFKRPTPAMKEDAKSRGIDLDAPAVVSMLEELQRQKDDPERATRKRAIVDRHGLNDLSVDDLLERLERHGQGDLAHCKNKSDLVDLLADALLDQADERTTGGGGPSKTKTTTKQKRKHDWRITAAITVVLVAFRLWQSGLLRSLITAMVHGIPLHEVIEANQEKQQQAKQAEPPLPGVFDQEDEEWLDGEF